MPPPDTDDDDALNPCAPDGTPLTQEPFGHPIGAMFPGGLPDNIEPVDHGDAVPIGTVEKDEKSSGPDTAPYKQGEPSQVDDPTLDDPARAE